MAINVDFWQLVMMLGAMAGFALGVLMGAGKLLLSQLERRLNDRFKAQDETHAMAQRHMDARFGAVEQSFAIEAKEWQRLERIMMDLKVDLPIMYVRRDDYVRNQSVIESKIDGLALRIENAILKGDRHG